MRSGSCTTKKAGASSNFFNCNILETDDVLSRIRHRLSSKSQYVQKNSGCCRQGQSSATCSAMEFRSVPILPTYAESSTDTKRTSLCPYRKFKSPDPVIILITLTVLVGSFCLLSGFILLCVVSKAWQDATSEAILLMAIGFFITSLSCVTWKLTNAQRLTQLRETIAI
ncbi:PREDICTED: uncharacterized protein LOC108616275 [Drosophila arizonae]|uniref:Uncharacterized protein LOC108616275 n=1 Tax=Drosophila arizonae TaxID=7263 RepID=A0ABM1PI17_DROAR|nr:PREDICTED: uncharacterized protein LOC108616275 [Drosophila arizonae]